MNILDFVRDYRRGTRCASDVVDELESLKKSRNHERCSDVWMHAVLAVHPVPVVLLSWAANNVDIMGATALRLFLREAETDQACHWLVAKAAPELCKSPDGLVAMLHESWRPPMNEWMPAMLDPAIAQFLERFS